MPFSSVIREKEINKYLKQRNTEEEHRVPGQVFIVDIFNLRNGIGLNFLNKLLLPYYYPKYFPPLFPWVTPSRGSSILTGLFVQSQVELLGRVCEHPDSETSLAMGRVKWFGNP